MSSSYSVSVSESGVPTGSTGTPVSDRQSSNSTRSTMPPLPRMNRSRSAGSGSSLTTTTITMEGAMKGAKPKTYLQPPPQSNRLLLSRPPQNPPDGSPWMDWVASSIEFFGCDPRSGTSHDVIGRALMLKRQTPADAGEPDLTRAPDCIRLHEDFFDALLKEQAERAAAGPTPVSVPPPALSYSRDDSFGSGKTAASTTSTHTLHTMDTWNSLSSNRTNRRRMPLRLGKSSPRGNRPARVSPIDAYDNTYNPSAPTQTPSATKLSLSQIIQKEDLLEPGDYLHPGCILQKDKGRGDPLGHAISAKGREACLDKLRDKMALVVQVAGEEHKPSTGMKRRPAKLSQHTSSLVETRSIIELRMGFLSLQYGLLLHWDSNNKITFIVLRKMCHDSFYTKIPAILHSDKLQRKHRNANVRRKPLRSSLPLVIHTSVGNQAVYQRPEGTEVVLLNPPYRVPQQNDFPPSNLTIIIHSIMGLSDHAKWSLSFTFDGHTEVARLQYNQERGFLENLSAPMKWQLNPAKINSVALAGLDIRLFKQSRSRNKKLQTPTLPSRLVASMTLPLGELVAQPAVKPSTLLHLTMPFPHDTNTQLTLELVHESEYSHWLYNELCARQLEEHANGSMTALLPSSNGLFESDDVPDCLSLSSESSYSNASSTKSTTVMMEWFCGICFKSSYC